MTASTDTAIWKFENAELDEASGELRIDGELVDVEPCPRNLLLLLLRRADEVVDYDEIIKVVWSGRFNDSALSNISGAIGKLRKLFKNDQKEIIRNVSKKGYRFVAPVERIVRPGPRESPKTELGHAVPGRPYWKLTEHLDAGGYGDVWVATHTKTHEERVFKFCSDEARLSALKREATLFRMLKDSLGDRAPVPPLLDWQFETQPYYLEAERWGCDLKVWTERNGGLSQLPAETRLNLMISTAEVVATVHAAGVLHKDLKPQNILVRGDLENPEVRLCDFGAGTMLEWGTLEDLNITRMGFTHTVAQAGTPMYLAPEIQAGGAPSIQSDVYSLGVLLYQLAIGEFRSVAFGWEGDLPDTLLRSDIASCIDRNPALRPPSASIIAEKLRTLEARRAQLEEERETERRNQRLAESLERDRARRPWMVTAAVALILAVGASSVLTLQARRAAHRAEENERVARGVADFLVNDILRQSSPDYGGRVDVTLKAAMLESAPKISQRLRGPVAAELNQALAEIVASLSANADAARLAREAAIQYAELYGAQDRRTLSAKVDEFSYRMLIEPGPSLLAEYEGRASKAIASLPSADPLAVKAAMVHAWMIIHFAGDMPIALTRFEEALEKAQGIQGREIDRAKLYYVSLLSQDGRYQDAQREAELLLPRLEKDYGKKGRLTLELRREMGRIHEAERGDVHDYAEAEAEYRQAINGLTELYGAESSEVSMVRMDLGDLLLTSGRLDQSEAVHRALLADFERLFGPDSFYTWRARHGVLLSLNLLAESDPDYAARAYAEAKSLILDARKRLPDSWSFRRLLMYCAWSMQLAWKGDEAEQLLKELEDLNAKDPPKGGQALFYEGSLNQLRGRLALHRGQEESALHHFSRAANAFSQSVGKNDPSRIEVEARVKELSAKLSTDADKPSPETPPTKNR